MEVEPAQIIEKEDEQMHTLAKVDELLTYLEQSIEQKSVSETPSAKLALNNPPVDFSKFVNDPMYANDDEVSLPIESGKDSASELF